MDKLLLATGIFILSMLLPYNVCVYKVLCPHLVHIVIFTMRALNFVLLFFLLFKFRWRCKRDTDIVHQIRWTHVQIINKYAGYVCVIFLKVFSKLSCVGQSYTYEYIKNLITIKTPNPECHLYWCFIEFIDWRYSPSCWYFLLSFVNYCTSNILTDWQQNSLQLMLVFMSWLFYVYDDLHTWDCTFAVWTWYLYYTKLQSTSYKTNPSHYILECKFEGLCRIFSLLFVISERLNPQ